MCWDSETLNLCIIHLDHGQLDFATLFSFLSPEIPLLLVSTENRDLLEDPMSEVRSSSTSCHSAHT